MNNQTKDQVGPNEAAYIAWCRLNSTTETRYSTHGVSGLPYCQVVQRQPNQDVLWLCRRLDGLNGGADV